MTNIIDKAQWHIDSGVDREKIINYFECIFLWLKEKDYLTDDGQEVLDIGVDSSISLNSKMVNSKGMDFLSQYYDKLLEQSELSNEFSISLLENYYKEYTSISN